MRVRILRQAQHEAATLTGVPTTSSLLNYLALFPVIFLILSLTKDAEYHDAQNYDKVFVLQENA